MKVVERVKKEYVAHHFTNDNKDFIWELLHWYHCNAHPTFGADGKPTLTIRVGNKPEVVIKLGEWIILDNTTDTVVEILSDEQFKEKYKNAEETVLIGQPNIINLPYHQYLNDTVPCSTTSNPSTQISN